MTLFSLSIPNPYPICSSPSSWYNVTASRFLNLRYHYSRKRLVSLSANCVTSTTNIPILFRLEVAPLCVLQGPDSEKPLHGCLADRPHGHGSEGAAQGQSPKCVADFWVWVKAKDGRDEREGEEEGKGGRKEERKGERGEGEEGEGGRKEERKGERGRGEGGREEGKKERKKKRRFCYLGDQISYSWVIHAWTRIVVAKPRDHEKGYEDTGLIAPSGILTWKSAAGQSPCWFPTLGSVPQLQCFPWRPQRSSHRPWSHTGRHLSKWRLSDHPTEIYAFVLTKAGAFPSLIRIILVCA